MNTSSVQSSRSCHWTECPSEIFAPESGSYKLWPFDKDSSMEERDNAMARLIVLGTVGTALYTRDSRVVVTGAGLLALLGIIGSTDNDKQKQQKQTAIQNNQQRLQQMASQVQPVSMDLSDVNVTAMGPIPVPVPEIPLYDCQAQQVAAPLPAETIDDFALQSANYLVGQMPEDEDNRDYNPYGNPNAYQTHYAVDGDLPKQPNEMDIHAQVLASSKMDIKKMFGKNGELDEGLFVTPLPDPTLHARPVFFPESYDEERPIWDNFNGTGNAYRQTM
uniref:PBCV-1 P9-like minor capsid protein n=1 Tax=Clandestinovirus TaxID=2831644 RepID=A0A8F8KQ00_9VIRU|nr:PBCV-1 P9-like minor capsid protein [Clandestinovirus]